MKDNQEASKRARWESKARNNATKGKKVSKKLKVRKISKALGQKL